MPCAVRIAEPLDGHSLAYTVRFARCVLLSEDVGIEGGDPSFSWEVLTSDTILLHDEGDKARALRILASEGIRADG
jgi:hypothetical protein